MSRRSFSFGCIDGPATVEPHVDSSAFEQPKKIHGSFSGHFRTHHLIRLSGHFGRLLYRACGSRPNQRTTSTEQGAVVTNAVETLPNRNLSKAPAKLRDPTKIESAFHFRASSTSTR